MPDRFYRGMKATEAMGQLNGLHNDVQAVKDATAAGVASAASSANQASAARDAAIAAWAASTAPAEFLAAMSQTIHRGAVVDAFLYDTGRDSDGGAWRKRCKHTSWESETLVPGKWMGSQASSSAARTAGGVDGDYYQSTNNGTFNQLIPGGVSEVSRGNAREFPALAAIVAEAGRVVIYDATKPDLPMWMVFLIGGNNWLRVGANVSSIAALNGTLFATGNAGEVELSFLSELPVLRTLASYRQRGNMAQRNSGLGYDLLSNSGGLIHATANDIAAIVLPDAPIDPATGLPVPTVAVATQGGLSIIKQDGTVANQVFNAGVGENVLRVAFTAGQEIACATGFNHVKFSDMSGVHVRSGAFYTSAPTSNSFPKLLTGGGPQIATKGAAIAHGVSAGMSLLHHNQSSLNSNVSKSMVAYITNTYNCGWQVGDTRGAWLADTVAETAMSSGEMITNGAFSENTNGWTAQGGGLLTIAEGELLITASGSAQGASKTIAVTAGKSYVVTAVGRKGTADLGIWVYDGAFGAGIPQQANTTSASNVPLSLTIKPTGNSITVYVRAAGAGTVYADNISVKLAEPDRSVKGNGLVVSGSLTKTPVAAGAQLIGYSGFSASNYLEQPYNVDLDFGTGDFCVMGWFSLPNLTSAYRIFERNIPGALDINKRLIVLVDTNGLVAFYCGAGAQLNGTVGLGLNHIVAMRRNGNMFLYLNGALVSTRAMSGDMTMPNSVVRVGQGITASNGADCTLALWKIGATAPSDDQIAQIYRDELALFQPGAQCTIDGSGPTVSALVYDDTSDLLHVGTPWGRSAFKGLQRVESEAAASGTITSLAATGGAVLTGAATAAKFTQPALRLRDELRRRYETHRAMAAVEIPLDFDGVAAQTTFPLPIGFTAKGVWVAGSKKRRGPTKDYTVTFDGYRETVVFGVSPGANWVQITANRSI